MKLVKNGTVHQDIYGEGDRLCEVVTGHCAVVVLNYNPGATFVHGASDPIPIQEENIAHLSRLGMASDAHRELTRSLFWTHRHRELLSRWGAANLCTYSSPPKDQKETKSTWLYHANPFWIFRHPSLANLVPFFSNS
jgi:hypothetical protein